MKWLNRLAALLFGLISVGVARDFLSKYEVVVFNKENIPLEDLEQEEEKMGEMIHLRPQNYDHAMDVRGTPTHVCPCGCNIWNVKVIFDDFEIATYFLDMECANCGSLATAPTPIDKDRTDI
jgi:hypothetical protein